MSNIVSVRDVARAAGVDKSTVSRVLSGKADQNRIRQTTQDHILAVARQLGYTRRPMAPYTAVAVPKPQMTSPDAHIQEQRIGLILSADSPASSLALIPGLDPILTAAGYELVVITLPADPASARKRLAGFLKTSTGILCCPTIYTAVSALVAPWPGKVVILWQGAAKAIIAKPTPEAPAPTYAPASLPMEGAALAAGVPEAAPPAVSHVEPSAPVDEVVLTEQNPPLSETPASTPQPVIEVPPLVSSVDADVPAASVASEAQPGSYAAGTAASTLPEPEIQRPLPSTPTTEQPNNLTTDPATTPTPTTEAPTPTYAPASLPMEGAALAAGVPEAAPPAVSHVEPSAPVDEVVLTEQNPPLSETPASTPQPVIEVPPLVSSVDADVPAASVASEAQPGSYAAGTAASTLPEPEIQRPLPSTPTTEQPEQPNNLTTAPTPEPTTDTLQPSECTP